MEIGIVSFFNVERGFGRIKTQDIPHGVFVHFSDVIGEAKILVENELVEFSVKETKKGPKACQVSRITDRLKGTIKNFNKGYGFVEEYESGTKYFLHHSDVQGNGFKRIESEFEVEFSPFESEKGLQAKEVVIIDTRFPLEKFANLGKLQQHLESLAQLAQPENWDYISQQTGSYPVLRNYLRQTFKRLEEEDKIEYTTSPDGKEYACFNTGLVTEKQEDIFAYFVRSRRKNSPGSYIKFPKWTLRKFERESYRVMSYFSQQPQIANYISDPTHLVYDSSKRLIPDYEHIIDDREKRFPEEFRQWGKQELIARLRNAISLAEKRVMRNYKTAIPQYYEGNIQLLLPLCLEIPSRIDMALVVAKEHEIYRANTVIPLDWAYQNARLLAPHDRGWLRE
ncbi:MAG: DUF3825 domain-containing protein [Bacteroidetes bacterium]|nr:DUF3825 domain-containing protein [Bacteroidota bacterium]MCB0841984.1 DUF3825 domain-containing protein [Bacteroidota bacterium]MCB0853676.1 DUF3825 domain-containing protein [Bacteroidota bacterium]